MPLLLSAMHRSDVQCASASFCMCHSSRLLLIPVHFCITEWSPLLPPEELPDSIHVGNDIFSESLSLVPGGTWVHYSCLGCVCFWSRFRAPCLLYVVMYVLRLPCLPTIGCYAFVLVCVDRPQIRLLTDGFTIDSLESGHSGMARIEISSKTCLD